MANGYRTIGDAYSSIGDTLLSYAQDRRARRERLEDEARRLKQQEEMAGKRYEEAQQIAQIKARMDAQSKAKTESRYAQKTMSALKDKRLELEAERQELRDKADSARKLNDEAGFWSYMRQSKLVDNRLNEVKSALTKLGGFNQIQEQKEINDYKSTIPKKTEMKTEPPKKTVVPNKPVENVDPILNQIDPDPVLDRHFPPPIEYIPYVDQKRRVVDPFQAPNLDFPNLTRPRDGVSATKKMYDRLFGGGADVLDELRKSKGYNTKAEQDIINQDLINNGFYD